MVTRFCGKGMVRDILPAVVRTTARKPPHFTDAAEKIEVGIFIGRESVTET